MVNVVRACLAVECKVGDATIAVPTQWVLQVVDLEISRVPLPRERVVGLAVYDGQVVPVLTVAGIGGGAPGTRTAPAVVIGATGGGWRCAIEISEVLRISNIHARDVVTADWPEWLTAGLADDGRSVALVDGGQLAHSFASGLAS